MDDAKNKINIDIVKGFVQGDFNTVNIVENRSGQINWNTRLITVNDLRLESFKLGGSAPAKFPYIITPIQNIYDDAVHALLSASTDTKHARHGILVLGESNAGKTRLALEALKETLPIWPVLRWRPDYTIDNAPPLEFLDGKKLVLFIDDLQDYALTQMKDIDGQNLIADPRATTLRTLIEMLLQALQHLVIVATCRIEDKSRTQAVLNWLFIQLTDVIVPTFTKDEKAPDTARIIAQFQRQGIIHKEDWDGTLGSLVLGLSTKNSQYLNLAESHAPAASLLQAMKLLNIMATQVHTERRLRTVCAYVFGKKKFIEDEETWQEAVNQLTRMQFVQEEVEDNNREIILVIRKDAYFEQVITDYPPPERPYLFKQHLAKLQNVLLELGDTEALLTISRIFMGLKRYEEALLIINQVLAINPLLAYAWFFKSSIMWSLEKYEEALTDIDHSLAINPYLADTWAIKGDILRDLMREEEALVNFDHALILDPNQIHASFWKSRMLTVLKRYEEALNAIDHTISLDPSDISEWAFKGRILHILKKYEEALSVFEHVLTLDPNHVEAWDNKISLLKSLGRNEQALAAFEHNFTLDTDDADMWFFRGNTLMFLKRYEEALTAINSALALESEYLLAWYAKGFTLSFLERYEEALAAFEQTLSFVPDNAKSYYFKGRILINLERYEEALTAFDDALKLNPNDVEALNAKVDILYIMERDNEALSVIEEVLRLVPDDINIWDCKGRILRDLNQYEESLVAFNHILSLDPNNIDAWQNKADVLRALGREKEARQAKLQVKKLSK